MIAKIKPGMSFKGLLDYANDIVKKGSGILFSQGVCLTSNATIAASFKAQAKSVITKKPFVGHLILAFSPQDLMRLNDEKLSEISREYLRRMNIKDTQCIVFRHYDQPHPHIHVVYNRVDDNGRFITSDTNWRRSVMVSKTLTREYGLTFGKGKEGVRRDRLKGKDKIKYHIYDTAVDGLKTCREWGSFINHMRKNGIGITLVSKPTKGVSGIVFSCEGVSFSGGRVDRSLTFGKLSASLGRYENQICNGASVPAESVSREGITYEKISSNPIITENQDSETFKAEGVHETVQPDSDTGGNDANEIGEAIIEAVMQPHIVPSSGGGGGSSDSLNDDDDKNKNRRKTRRR